MHQGWRRSGVLLFVLPLFCVASVKGPPKVHQQSRLITGEEGDPVKLPCPISATPEPLYEWRKDGRPVDDTWPRYVLRRHFLRIKSAREEDSGEFTCTGVNGFGKASFTFSLLIYGENLPPLEQQTSPVLTEVSPTLLPFRTRVGETLTLACKAEGVPAPKITWFKDGLPLHKSGPKLRFVVESASENAGVYSCVATNPLAIVSHNFSIVVEEKPTEEEPEILQMTNTSVLEGGNTTLHCFVRSFLLPEIQWLKLLSPAELASLPKSLRNRTVHNDGKTYHYVTSPGTRMEKSNGTYLSKLFIGNAAPGDAGVYVCVGATRKGYNYKEIHLSVVPNSQKSLGDEELKHSDMNLLLIILPVTATVVVGSIAAFICKTMHSAANEKKTHPAGAQNTTLETEDPTSNTPLTSYKNPKAGAALPPDIVYQDGSSYITHLSNIGPANGSVRYTDPYLYPENSYLEPNYSDPYLEPHDSAQRLENQQPFDTRCSDHSYARLTQSTQSSTSPLPPPPYAYQLPFTSNPSTHSHTLSHQSIHQTSSPFTYTTPHPHTDTKYVIHYNL